jgi:hypothetical protein
MFPDDADLTLLPEQSAFFTSGRLRWASPPARHLPGKTWQAVCINRFSLKLVFILLTAVLFSCSTTSDPEQIASAFIEDAAAAFENRNARALRKLISSDYVDSQNRTAEQIASIGSLYIMRSRSIYLFTELDSAVQSGDRVLATVLGAFAARPVKNRGLLPQVNADLYWFEIALKEENGDWKIVSSSWRQAMLEDVFSD